MRTIPSSLRSHLDGGATTLCNCWWVERKDGVVLGFTDHDRPLTFDNVTYEAMTGFLPATVESELGLNTSAQDLVGALSSPGISDADIETGRYDNAKIRLYLVNWQSTEDRFLLRAGSIGEITQSDGAFAAEFRGITSDLDQVKGRQFSSRCDAVLGDQKCGVSLGGAQFSASGTVLDVDDRSIVTVSGLSNFAAEWFGSGQLTWLTGANAGLSIEVARHEVNNGVVRLHLWQSMPTDIAAGDTFSVSAGCDKTFATCKVKFGNHVNYRGFPHIPGKDFALGYAAPEVDHDGSPLVG
ncbi:MAG: DUF2163 domain-containing protein [Pseudomonadota bacterium]